MKSWKLALLACTFVLPVSAASAQAIFSPTGGVINTGGPGFGNLADTWNHNGLLTNFTNNVTNFNTYIAGNPQHDLVFAGNEWFSNDGLTSAVVTYDLGSVRAFDRLALWNEDASGIGTLNVQTSTDNVTFTNLFTANPTNNPVNANYPAQVFSFATRNARYVRFNMSACPQSDNPQLFQGCAIGEVAFRAAAAIPEPGTWALMISGFGFAGLAMRRRRRPVIALA